MKKTLLYLSIFIFLVSLLQFFGCTLKRDAVTYVVLHLNPSVEFVLDTANRIVSINALNDDGELLLSIENLQGKEVKQALRELLTTASESGLFDVDNLNGLVSLSVVNESAQYSMTMFDSLKEVCTNYFKTNGIYALVANATLPSEVVELAQMYNIPTGHFLLMLKLQAYRPDMSFLEITQMSVKDIIKLFNEELISVGKIYLKEQKQNFKTELFSLRQTYEENLKTLFGSEYVTLLGELALMEAQIEVVEGAQLETLKNAISAKLQQIETLRSSLEITHQAEFQALRTQYQADVQQLKESFINATREQLQTLKTTMQNRIVAQESKLQARIAYAKNRVNNFRQKYETFLALKENDLFNFLKTKLEELNQIDAQTEVEFAVSIVRARKY
ncbi:MAG: hypothetical protein CVV61_08350, partial [Tenericutes bacterium HGW-Tenericutes-6]